MATARVRTGKNRRAQTRAIYEKHPYPAPDSSALKQARWSLAPLEWIMALWRPGQEQRIPKRILVAGCGTGTEAFLLMRKFPQAAVIAVDFSPRSIAIAKKLSCSSAEMKRISFFVGDLSSPGLKRITGGNFDFITCHGVLSYIPKPQRILKNLARQLSPAGALFLGVNGAAHFSVGGRPVLTALGFEIKELKDESRLRKFLPVWESILEASAIPGLPDKNMGYLAGDLFGPLIHNFPLATWRGLAAAAGLHLCDSYSCWKRRRTIMGRKSASLLIPKSRAEIAVLLDLASADSFHRLLFQKKEVFNPPWDNWRSLLETRPVRSPLYAVPDFRRKEASGAMRKVTLKSAILNTRLDWQMPRWETEILRQSDGTKTVREILRSVPETVPIEIARQQLYNLHQLLILTLLPPA